MTRAHRDFATVPHERNLFVFGGRNLDEWRLLSTEILNIDTMESYEGPSMRSVRQGCAAIQLDASRILVLGGDDGITYLNTTEVLNTDTM